MLSIIIPAYKQEKTIVKDIQNVEAALKEMGADYEIVVVCDGQLDQTYEKASTLKSGRIRVFVYPGANRGKGYALRYGAARAKGDLICFLDSGMEINPRGIQTLFDLMKRGDADIVVGSKLHPASKVNYPAQRRITSLGYRLLTRILFGLKVRDTQTGLKIFKREVLEKVLPRLLVKAYAIDIEILALSYYFGFRRIFEAPVEVAYNFEDLTHSSQIKPIIRMIEDTLAVFYRLKILHYYDDKNKSQWACDKDLEMKVITA